MKRIAGLSSELRAKRDRLAQMVRAAGWQPIVPESGYFMMASFKVCTIGCFRGSLEKRNERERECKTAEFTLYFFSGSQMW